MNERAGSRPPADEPGSPAPQSRLDTAVRNTAFREAPPSAGAAVGQPGSSGSGNGQPPGDRPARIKPSRVEPGRPKDSPPEPPPAPAAPPARRDPPALPAVRDTAPPWSQVIVTTIQLWVDRKVHRGRGSRRPRRWAGAFALAVVLVAVWALTIVLAQHRSAPGGGPAASGSRGHAHTTRANQGPRLGTAALAAAARNRQQAAAWITAQVSHAAIVSCDPVMCQALMAARFPAGDLLTLGPSATDPMGSQIVADDTVLRNQLGGKLTEVYAPVVLASFGTGATQVEVRLEAPDGARAYLLAERADQLARRQSGHELLSSPGLHVTGAARQAIAAGQVDSRLLVTLVALLGQQYPVYVSSFGDLGPGATPGVPLRSMRIDALVRHGSHTSSRYLHSVLHFLASQQPPYRAGVSVLHLSRARTSIRIEFAAPSPLGLLGAKTK